MPVHTETVGRIGRLTLDRPGKANAYDRAHLDALLDAARALAERCPVLIVQAAGASFCGGADLDELGAASPLDALELRSQRVFTAFARLPCVSIAAIQGPAVAGGFELALACDLRVAGPAARFWLPETRLGIVPSAGGTTRLTRLAGPSRAKEVILGGRELDVETAFDWGLVHRVAPDPQAEALLWAEQVAGHDPAALRLAKELIDASESDGALARERQAEAVLYSLKNAR
jgi:enoyl-CoA hydratase